MNAKKQQQSTCSYLSFALQEINISHLGKRKIIFKMDFPGDMLVPWRVIISFKLPFFILWVFGAQTPPLGPSWKGDDMLGARAPKELVSINKNPTFPVLWG